MLNRIITAARTRLEHGGTVTEGDISPRRDFGAAIARPGLQVIAEIKRRSPSAGDLNMGMDPAAQAAQYERGGAAAISVLTEPEFFGGSLADLVAVRAAVSLPVLRKDFIVDPRQVAESRLIGADALLLIVAALDVSLLQELLTECKAVGIDALVEAHNEAEAEIAADSGARIIGVNNRDLATFKTDLAVAERIAPQLPRDRVLVGESGVSSRDGAERMAAAGYNAILVGQALVTAADPAGLIGSLKSAAL